MSNEDQKPGGSLSRRIFLRGAGVMMALPWLESVPVWGATEHAAKAFCGSVYGNRNQPEQLVCKGRGRDDGVEQKSSTS